MITIDKETTYLVGFTEDAINEFMPYEYTKIAIILYDELNKVSL